MWSGQCEDTRVYMDLKVAITREAHSYTVQHSLEYVPHVKDSRVLNDRAPYCDRYVEALQPRQVRRARRRSQLGGSFLPSLRPSRPRTLLRLRRFRPKRQQMPPYEKYLRVIKSHQVR